MEELATASRPTLDAYYMGIALAEARRSLELGEVPIGAVVVHAGEVVGAAGNRRELDANPAGHAEVLAMQAAARHLGRWRLSGCTVYVTLEPCLMCAGLMQQARITRCVFGAHDQKAGALGSLYEIHMDTRLNHTFAVSSGILADECAALLQRFFADRRDRR